MATFITITKIIICLCFLQFSYSEENNTPNNIQNIFTPSAEIAEPSEATPEEELNIESNATSVENGTTSNETVTEQTTDISANVTETKAANTNATSNKVVCKPQVDGGTIEVVNSTRLLKLLMSNPNITTKDTPANCNMVFFYGVSCPFSGAATAQYTALARIFPNIKMVAIDAMTHHIFNAQNGIVGVPTLMLFHNGRAVAKYNESEYKIDLLVKFIGKHTIGIVDPDVDTTKYYVTSDDFRGPLSHLPEYQRDYCLGLSWIFICLCTVYFFSQSKWWKWIVETIQNTWRESEAQHEHTD
ncbi:uncharacterized protein LOC123301002 [Chrysoperla carnea]|uniref:uncharacterized protein LOC123301002 n=1 Tax=Chrysoperla carnea TaxID=189513 RepID=UPI001D0834E4|nr:uncharacterized protein LOC123301002 [Chrysoperla carnea]